MKNIPLFFFGISLMVLSGCAGLSVLNPAGNHYTGNYPCAISVGSNPSGADVYLNGVLVGKTPANVTILLKWEMNTWGMDFTQRVTEQYMLKIVKKDYKEAVQTIPVKSPVTGVLWGEPPRVGLSQSVFNFNLQREEADITFQQEQKEISDEVNNTEELRKYKQLFDEGVISKEEFEKKKQQLLGI